MSFSLNPRGRSVDRHCDHTLRIVHEAISDVVNRLLYDVLNPVWLEICKDCGYSFRSEQMSKLCTRMLVKTEK